MSIFDFCICVVGSQDYNAVQENVTFSVGVSSVSFSVPIIDDQVLEQDEWFIVGISMLPNNVIFGETSQTTVTIVNDDSKQLLHKSYVTKYACMYLICVIAFQKFNHLYTTENHD